MTQWADYMCSEALVSVVMNDGGRTDTYNSHLFVHVMVYVCAGSRGVSVGGRETT